MNSGTVRIRLVFEEGHLLRKSQRKNGLKRSWILLKSHLRSISDFSSYLLDSFLLRGACPDGLVLSVSLSLSLSGYPVFIPLVIPNERVPFLHACYVRVEGGDLEF